MAYRAKIMKIAYVSKYIYGPNSIVYHKPETFISLEALNLNVLKNPVRMYDKIIIIFFYYNSTILLIDDF